MVLASNRPLELAELLASLLRQEGAVIERRKIFLFQDGGLDASGARHWSDAVLLENVDIFRRLVPDGIPLPSYLHLGPVLTRDRAERFAFDDLQAEAAVLLGDDMILGRCYLRTLDRLLALASADPRIAQVSADGDTRASLADQRAHSSRLIPLGRAPGRGLLRRDWLRQRRYMDAYLRCARDPAAIRATRVQVPTPTRLTVSPLTPVAVHTSGVDDTTDTSPSPLVTASAWKEPPTVPDAGRLTISGGDRVVTLNWSLVAYWSGLVESP